VKVNKLEEEINKLSTIINELVENTELLPQISEVRKLLDEILFETNFI